jgi:hypothetical protein
MTLVFFVTTEQIISGVSSSCQVDEDVRYQE